MSCYIMCHVMLYNVCDVMLYNVSCYVICVMLYNIVMSCYITCVMSRNVCHVI